MGKRKSPLRKSITSMLLSLVLAFGLCPAWGSAFAATGDTTDADDAFVSSMTAAEDASTSSATSEYEMIAQAEEDGTCVAGQALVVYHASGAAKGSTGTLSIQSETDPLEADGFGPSEVVDLSAADNAESSAIAAADGALSVQSTDGDAIASGSDVRVALVERDDMSVADLVTALEALDYVECAQPNYIHEPCSVTSPDDPLYSTYNFQYGLSSTTAGIDYQAALVADAQAGAAAEDNIVAVIDSGIDYTNPDLANQMWDNPGNIEGLPGNTGTHGYDCFDLDDDIMPGSSSGSTHGTHCAGLVAAETDNNEGVAGVAQHTKVMGLKIESDDGTAGWSDITISRAFAYVITAKLGGQNVVAASCSWHIGSYDPVLDYLVNQAGKAGVVTLFAAGNNGDDVAVDNNYSSTAGLQSPYAIIVASSNSKNELSSFSNYDVTAVDLAAPGEGMLSTIRTSQNGDIPGYFNDPTLSLLTGKKAFSTEQLGNLLATGGTLVDGASIVLEHYDSTTSKWSNATETDLAHLTYGAGEDVYGMKALKLTIKDIGTLSDTDIDNYQIRIKWSAPSPFYGQTVDPAGYVTDIGIAEVEGSATTLDVGLLTISDGTNTSVRAGTLIEAGGVEGENGTFSAIDTTAEKLKYNVRVRMWDPTGTGDAVCEVATANIFTADGFSAYGYMSGTSMAIPTLAGCYAELASLYPDDSPLQLRGRLVGSTEPVTMTKDTSDASSKGQDKVTATNGRFSFVGALDPTGAAAESAISANTWSISCSGNAITVHGYGLGDASLYVDETTHTRATLVTSQTDDSITFTADKALFDGAAHRFDVVDASTGKAYTASYIVAKQDDPVIAIGTLPSDITSGNAQLVSAPDRLFACSIDGNTLYSCANPDEATSATAWTQLAAPAKVFAGNSGANGNELRYAYRDGKLYAFCTSNRTIDDTTALVALCATYDIASDAWSEAKVIATFGTGEFYSVWDPTNAFASEGEVCYSASYYDNENHWHYKLLLLEPGSDTFKQVEVPAELSGYLCTVNGIYRSGSTTYFLACLNPLVEGGDFRFGIFSYDGATITDMGELSGAPAAPLTQGTTFSKAPMVCTGNGIFGISPASFAGIGDAAFIDPLARTWTGLGSLLGSSTSAITIVSGAMLNGKVYLAGTDTNSTGCMLYTLPDSAAVKLLTTDVEASAVANAGGKASVSNWCNKAAAKISVRGGDSATWTATPDSGHIFAGWYDASGKLVSTDTTYSTVVTQATTVRARFESSRVVRLWGDSALDTMTAIVGAGFDGTGGTVVLATLDNFPDALTAAGIAGLAGAPVLLTGGSELSEQTQAELELLKPSKIIVCGGASAISDDVANAAKAAAGARRLYRCAGSTRSGTACEIYRNAEAYTGQSFGTTAFIATGTGFADALSIAPYAYAQHCPVFLAEDANTVSDQTLQTMEDGGITSFYVLGGTAAISDDAVSQLEASGFSFSGRLAGDSRYATSQAIAQFEIGNGMSAFAVGVATGENYKDALCGASLCGRGGYSLVLVSNDDRTTIDGLVKDNKSSIKCAYIFGGTAAVSQGTEDYLVKILG